MQRYAMATIRNRGPILEVLRTVVPAGARVLEIASGTGEHAVYFSSQLPVVFWQPSDPDPEQRASIGAWIEAASATLVGQPLALDAMVDDWPALEADVIVNVNMLQVTPWAACVGLFRHADRILGDDGRVVMYGPFNVGGEHTSRGNALFDASLRARHPEWGLRDVDEVAAAAEAHGFRLAKRVAMPANNLTLLFERPSP